MKTGNIKHLKQHAVFTIQLPENPTAVTFINGIKARNIRGWLWLLTHSRWIRKSVAKASGCVQVKTGYCSLKEIITVSYWDNEVSLMGFFKSAEHRKMLSYIVKHPNEFILFNEIYSPSQTGRYTAEKNGLALLYDANI